MGVTPYMLAHALHVSEQEERLRAGVKGVVHGYYDNYTDATELEPGVVHTINEMLGWTDLSGLDTYELIKEAEVEINAGGGIRSDTDGTRHQVRTGWVWDEVEDDG